MLTTKVKGTIDEAGKLRIDEPLNLMPGEVEVIIVQNISSELLKAKEKSEVKSLRKLLEIAPPIASNVAPEEARWEALKEKYNL
jgi:hypothetical protein